MTEKEFPYPIDHLDTPALVIDQSILDLNIRDMQSLADRFSVKLRPHVKTHKSPALAERQLKAGAVGIAVAKLSEAEIMAAHGIADIEIANEIVSPPKMQRLLDLSAHCRISCAIDSKVNAQALSDLFQTHSSQLDVLIEVDTGLHRCGLQTVEQIVELARHISGLSGLRLQGLMTHAGHAYGATSESEIAAIGAYEGEFLVRAAESVRSAGIPLDVVSVGSTPTARYAGAVYGVTELRVGNYIFNDCTQVALGVAPLARCALSVLVTVISVPSPERAVIDAGSKVFTSDAGAHGRQTVIGFGKILSKRSVLSRLSEEHGIVIVDNQERFAPVERLRIVPNHACAVMNMFDVAYVIDGSQVVQKIEIAGRGCVT